MVTIKDIARETGLSSATVARALSDSGPAQADTRRRVRETAERLGYVASSAARAMRNQSSNMIGLIVPDIVNRFYSEMAKAIGAACQERELHFLLATSDDDPALELRQMRAMVSARVAALALVPGPGSGPGLAALAARQPFAQLVRRSSVLSADWFGFEEQDAIYRATVHLLDLGHRDIALVCGGSDLSTGAGRRAGYARALRVRGLVPDPRMVRAGPPTLAHGRAALHDLPGAATAVIAAGTLLTEAAVQVIDAQGRNVPSDLSLIGFGVESWHRWWRGGLTRVVPPVDLLTRSCAESLLARISAAKPAPGEPPRTVTHDARLIIGRTTAPPRS